MIRLLSRGHPAAMLVNREWVAPNCRLQRLLNNIAPTDLMLGDTPLEEHYLARKACIRLGPEWSHEEIP
jgi:hypothetical protein